MTNNISFTGKFTVDVNQLSKVPPFKRAQYLLQKDILIDEFCKSKNSIKITPEAITADIKEGKEGKLLEIARKFGIELQKLD